MDNTLAMAALSKAPARQEKTDLRAIDVYLNGIAHQWARTLTALGITLVPLFLVLDYYMLPRELFPRFVWYRGICEAIIVGQLVVLRLTQPSSRSFLHGYFFNLVVGGMIALMTTDLGGFDSTYYAGMNLVLIAVNLLIPWSAFHSAINSVMTLAMYVGLNLVFRQRTPFRPEILINNLYFLASTGVITTAITFVKQALITQEFHLRSDLKNARDKLWSEMEVAKRIQTALLPRTREVNGYQVSAVMLPADEVGGDYYDVVETARGETWLCIGDVSGHGVESGLIMMMAQTSVFSAVNRVAGKKPSEVLAEVNQVLKKNINRLGADRYMTCMVIQLEPERIVYSGKHQEVLIWRERTQQVEILSTDGVWLGLVDDIEGLLADESRPIEAGDVILLYTDGVTEAMTRDRKLYGEERLREALAKYAKLPPEEIVRSIVDEVTRFMHKQNDDITVVALKRAPGVRSAQS